MQTYSIYIGYFKRLSRRLFNYFSAKILSRFSTYSIAPTMIFLGITNKCNMKCDYCFQSEENKDIFGHREQGFMNEETFTNFLNQIDGWVSYISINLFGEPTIHPKLKNWIKLLHDRNIRLNIITNGKKLSDELIKSIVINKVERISFSLEVESYNSIRIGANFEEVISNIKKLINERGNSTYPIISVQSVKSSLITDKEYIKHENYLKHIGVNEVNFSEIKNWSGEIKTGDNLMEGAIINKCEYPWTTMTVDWDGAVTSCCEDFSIKNQYANLNKSHLKMIWKSEEIKKLRKYLIKNDVTELKENTGCHNCSVLLEPVGLNSKTSLKNNVNSTLNEIKALYSDQRKD